MDAESAVTDSSRDAARKVFVLQEIQPALLGLMDGSVSTLAPIFATAGLTGKSASAFFVGLAASLGAAVSMGSPKPCLTMELSLVAAPRPARLDHGYCHRIRRNAS